MEISTSRYLIFLNKVWKLFYDENNLIVDDSEPDSESLKILNHTIKKIID